MAKIAWSRTASDAFAALVTRERGMAGQASADALRQGIGVRVRLLRGFPELGKPLPELPDGDLRELPIGPYRILYRNTSETVLILNLVEAENAPARISAPTGDWAREARKA